jgi:hypothetical protein
LITWNEAVVNQLRLWGVPIEGAAPKTMILSQDNNILYSDMFAPQSLLGMTNPATGGAVGLLVYRAGQYDLSVWNEIIQRFE